jgi:hypothetical protein
MGMQTEDFTARSVRTIRPGYQDSRFTPPARLNHVEILLNSQAFFELKPVSALVAYSPVK